MKKKKLFFINISIPLKVEFGENEYINTIRVTDLFDYIHKTELLIGPYYSIKNKEQ